jgi:hypothetical protein
MTFEVSPIVALGFRVRGSASADLRDSENAVTLRRSLFFAVQRLQVA